MNAFLQNDVRESLCLCLMQANTAKQEINGFLHFTWLILNYSLSILLNLFFPYSFNNVILINPITTSLATVFNSNDFKILSLFKGISNTVAVPPGIAKS